MAIDRLAEWLARLVQAGHLPSSTLSATSKKRLRSLFESRVLETERAGAGSRIVIRDESALRRFISVNYPSGLDGWQGEEFLARARAVASVRDAKKVRSLRAGPALLRGFGEVQLLANGKVFDVASLTRSMGLAGLWVANGCPWSLAAGCVGVVGNLEVFYNVERIGVGCDLVIYSGGCLAGYLLTWLASSAFANCSFLLVDDYDPVGLQEYLRLAAACPGRTRVYKPDGLKALIERYGKVDLLADSSELLAQLRNERDPTVQDMVAILDGAGRGLEQEVLLLVRSASGAS